VLIYNNTVWHTITKRQATYATLRVNAFSKMLSSAAQHLNISLPNTLFLLNAEDVSICRRLKYGCRAPAFTFFKRRPISEVTRPHTTAATTALESEVKRIMIDSPLMSTSLKGMPFRASKKLEIAMVKIALNKEREKLRKRMPKMKEMEIRENQKSRKMERIEMSNKTSSIKSNRGGNLDSDNNKDIDNGSRKHYNKANKQKDVSKRHVLGYPIIPLLNMSNYLQLKNMKQRHQHLGESLSPLKSGLIKERMFENSKRIRGETRKETEKKGGGKDNETTKMSWNNSSVNNSFKNFIFKNRKVKEVDDEDTNQPFNPLTSNDQRVQTKGNVYQKTSYRSKWKSKAILAVNVTEETNQVFHKTDIDLLLPHFLRPYDNLYFYPWHKKKDKALLRGAIQGTMGPMSTRYRLAKLSLNDSGKDHLDVGIVSHRARFKPDPNVMKSYLPQAQHAKWKFLLNADGHTASCRLGAVMQTNSVVLRQRSHWIEYYYRSLEPYKHYIPYDIDSIVDVMEELKKPTHNESLRAMALASQRFKHRYLNSNAKALFTVRALSAYSEIITDLPKAVETLAAKLQSWNARGDNNLSVVQIDEKGKVEESTDNNTEDRVKRRKEEKRRNKNVETRTTKHKREGEEKVQEVRKNIEQGRKRSISSQHSNREEKRMKRQLYSVELELNSNIEKEGSGPKDSKIFLHARNEKSPLSQGHTTKRRKGAAGDGVDSNYILPFDTQSLLTILDDVIQKTEKENNSIKF